MKRDDYELIANGADVDGPQQPDQAHLPPRRSRHT